MYNFDGFAEQRAQLIKAFTDSVGGIEIIPFSEVCEADRNFTEVVAKAGITVIDGKFRPIPHWENKGRIDSLPIGREFVCYWVFPEGKVFKVAITRMADGMCKNIISYP